MTLTTYEGIVEKGKIRLKTDVNLPENAKVYVIVPDMPLARRWSLTPPSMLTGGLLRRI